MVAELVVNDYLGDDFADSTQLEETVVETPDEIEVPEEEVIEEPVDEPLDPELRGDEEEVGEIEVPEEDVVEEVVEEVVAEITGNLTQELLATLDFTEPVLTTTLYDGLVYGFWDVSEDFTDMTVLQHKLFDGADYIGTVYEVQPGSSIELFTAYETLRKTAESSGNGTINENNAYGDASFYFNHETKSNTVFLTVRTNDLVYSLEYSPNYHVTIRSLIELL